MEVTVYGFELADGSEDGYVTQDIAEALYHAYEKDLRIVLHKLRTVSRTPFEDFTGRVEDSTGRASGANKIVAKEDK